MKRYPNASPSATKRRKRAKTREIRRILRNSLAQSLQNTRISLFLCFLFFSAFSAPPQVHAPRGPEGTVFASVGKMLLAMVLWEIDFSHETRHAQREGRLLCFLHQARCDQPKTTWVARRRFSRFQYDSRRFVSSLCFSKFFSAPRPRFHVFAFCIIKDDFAGSASPSLGSDFVYLTGFSYD